MANLTKLYLRDATTIAIGAIEIDALGTATLDVATPTVVASGAATSRTLSSSLGTAQVQADLTTLAQTAAQSGWIRRFVSDQLAAQTIGAQSVSLVGAFSESGAQSDFRPTFGLYLWRPSGSKVITTLVAVGSGLANEPGTTQTLGTATATTTAATAAAGDVLVLEVWRNSATQTNATALTNSIYYGGTAENSTTSNAAYLSFATAISVPAAYASNLTASLSPSAAALGTAYTPAPAPGGVTASLTAVLTHTE